MQNYFFYTIRLVGIKNENCICCKLVLFFVIQILEKSRHRVEAGHGGRSCKCDSEKMMPNT